MSALAIIEERGTGEDSNNDLHYDNLIGLLLSRSRRTGLLRKDGNRQALPITLAGVLSVLRY